MMKKYDMKTGRSLPDPSLFSGILYPYDFEPEYYSGRNMASRIASDWRFDARCKRNTQNRDQQNQTENLFSNTQKGEDTI